MIDSGYVLHKKTHLDKWNSNSIQPQNKISNYTINEYDSNAGCCYRVLGH